MEMPEGREIVPSAAEKREYARTWRQKNRDKILVYAGRYRGKSKEKRADYAKEYGQGHREEITDKVRDWRKKNPEKVAVQRRRHYENHTDSERAKSRVGYHRRKSQVDPAEFTRARRSGNLKRC